MGLARRVSETTNKDTVYAAVRLVSPNDQVLGVLRVARPVHAITAVTGNLTRFARNVAAVAVSFAIGLSLLAAVLFMRPLQRVIATSKALAAGDLAARSDVSTDDEVGDTARAIDAMAVELRRRLANAGSGDAVLSQLVDALPVPCAVFEATGSVLAINAAGRIALHIDGPHAGRHVKALTSSPEFQRAFAEAENDGEPEPITLEFEGAVVHGRVHVLKRPGTAPLSVLLGEVPPASESSGVSKSVPRLDSVVPRPFDAVLADARENATGKLGRENVQLEVSVIPTTLVACVEGRLETALTTALTGCTHGYGGRGGTLNVDIHVEDTHVRVVCDALPDPPSLARIRTLLEPLGGELHAGAGEVTLWLPRA